MKRTLLSIALVSATGIYAAQPVDTLKTAELQEVQVRSTRAAKNTPMAFSDLNREQIKQVNYGQDVPYLLSLTPSVTTSSDAGNGIGYTAIRVRGTDATRVNVTANGIPMNDAESGGLYWVNMGDFASSVQSMQIQRGVGTSTNGAGAFGATINMQTENIGTQPFVGIDASGGSYYSHKETVRFGTGLMGGGHWGLQGRLSNIGSKGYLDRASTRLNSYFLQAGYFGESTVVKLITFNGEEETYHAWNYASKYEQSLYGRRYNSCGLMYTDDTGQNHYYPDQTDNYHQQHYQLLWNELFSRRLNMNVALHYTKGQGYYEQYKSGYGYGVALADYGLSTDPDALGHVVNQKKMDNDFFGAIASLNYDNRQGLQASVGGGWNKYVGDHFGLVKWARPLNDTDAPVMADPDWEYYRDQARKTDLNVYGKATYEVLQGLSAFLDLQYRHIDYEMEDPSDYYRADKPKGIVMDNQFNFFNPKVGVNYQPSTHHRLYASYAIAHKEPTRNDYQDNPGTELKAERLNDLELGYQYRSARFSAGLNLYWMDYKDQFVLTGELNHIGEPIARNAGTSYRLGAEIEAAWQPTDWLRWDANATLSTNKAKDWTIETKDGETVDLGDTHLSFSPDLIVNNILTFSYKGARAAVQSQYVGEQYLTNTGFKSYTNYAADGSTQEVGMMLDGHFTTNVDLAYTFALKGLGIREATVGLTLYNLFSAEFDNNGWASPKFRRTAAGDVEAYRSDDLYEAGFAPSAPFHLMCHVSLTF